MAPLSETRRGHFAGPRERTEFDPPAAGEPSGKPFAAREAEPLRRRSVGSPGS